MAPQIGAPTGTADGVTLAAGLVTNITPSKEVQGVVTGYLFAVDADRDRGARDGRKRTSRAQAGNGEELQGTEDGRDAGHAQLNGNQRSF